jgi:hypothetical protein
MAETPLTIAEKLNRSGVELLMTDADLALTYVEIAETTRNASHSKQAVRDARRAYDVISAKRSEFRFSQEEAERLQAKLSSIRERLTKLGESFHET